MAYTTKQKQTAMIFYWIFFSVVLIGALNWLTIGLFELDLVKAISFGSSGVARSVYVLVGLSGIGALTTAILLKQW